jgi:hypothetical protein
MELWRLSPGTRRDSRSQLMDELSTGLSLRGVDTTFRHEFEAALDGRQAERQVAYSHFQDVFPPVLTLPFAEQWVAMSIKAFMNEWWNGARERSAARMHQGFLERAQQENELRQKNQSTRKELEESEWNGTFRALSPAMLSVLAEEFKRDPTLRELIREIVSVLLFRRYPSRKLRDILDSCPSFWWHYKCMTALRWDRPTEGNDMWDFLHAAMAVPYVDCLATDGGTRHICAIVLRRDKKFVTRITSQVPELIDWLKDL